MQFEKINIIDLTVVIILGIALIMTVFFHMEQSIGIISSGLIGYLGGTAKSLLNKNNEIKEGK